jgi:hypothetical protein
MMFYFWIIIAYCIFVMLWRNNTTSFPLFIAGDIEPRPLIKLCLFIVEFLQLVLYVMPSISHTQSIVKLSTIDSGWNFWLTLKTTRQLQHSKVLLQLLYKWTCSHSTTETNFERTSSLSSGGQLLFVPCREWICIVSLILWTLSSWLSLWVQADNSVTYIVQSAVMSSWKKQLG